MQFESGITIFKVNEPILLENISSPGFDSFELLSILGSDEIKLTNDFPIGKTFEYSYGIEGERTVVLRGIKNVAGTSFIDQKSVTFSVGYPPTQTLTFEKRSDQSSSYDLNYVQKGISFSINLIEVTASTEPKTYVWNYNGGQTFTSVSSNPQIISFSTIGFKNLGVTVSNIFGTASSNINFVSIDTPVIGISASPDFGIVRTGESLSLTAKLLTANQHGWNDLRYNWLVNGVTYEGKAINLLFDEGITVGVTFSYSSLILTGLSGSTSGTYNVFEVPGIYSIYVSGTTGDDSWSGKYAGVSGTDGPVKTLKKASELAAGYTGDLDIDIKIGGGIYQLVEQSLYLTGGNSGIDKVVTYKPYDSSTVVISGGYTLSPSLFTLVTAGNTLIYNRLRTEAQGNVYGADLSSLGISFGNTLPQYWNGRGIQNKYLPSIPDLIYNGNKMTVARWPNRAGATNDSANPFSYSTSATIESVVNTGSSSVKTPLGLTNGIFKYPSSIGATVNRWSATGSSSYDGIWIHGFWKWDWHDEIYQVKSINKTTREIEVYSSQGIYGIGGCVSGGSQYISSNLSPRRWFAFNLLDELSSAGEYYLDRNAKKLYFWPPTPIGSTSDIVLSSIRIAGDNSWVPGTPVYADSQLQQQSHLNTNAVNASLFKFNKLKNVVIDGLEFRNMSGSGIEMTLCENVTIKNCKIYSPRKNGIVVVGGKDNTIDTCEIYYTGLRGVILSGGNRQELISANNTLKNSKIIGFGTNSCNFSQGVLLTGVGNIVRKNIIANSNSRGIDVSGNNHIIEYNNFTNLASGQDDTGGIYLANNISDRNTIIRYNFFNNIKTTLPGGPYILSSTSCPVGSTKVVLSSAIYVDQYNSGTSIYSNVFYNCGSTLGDGDGAVFITHGLDNTVTNNIIVDSKVGVGHYYASKSNWNTNSVGLLSGESRISTGALQQIINVDDDPWYEDGAPESTSGLGLLFPGRDYTPYSFYASGYGVEGTYRSTKGLLNKVNITSDVWTGQYPNLGGVNGMIQYDSNSYTLTFNPTYPMVNYVTKNVLVNVGQTTKILKPSQSESTFFTENNYTGATYDIFVNKNALNFKLTSSALASIQSIIPGFEDIPFEQIPVL